MTKIAASLTALTIAATPVAAQDSYRGYESPHYTVVSREGPIELRQYAPALMAEVQVQADRSAALRAGFRILAGYIFGGNTSTDKIAMTSPVTQTASEKIAMTSPVTQSGADGIWTVSFMMPSSYSLETLPVPNTNTIRFVETTPSTKLVMQFSGWATAGRLQDYEHQLRRHALRNGIKIAEPAQYAYYDDPMTLPWKRRNEVAFAVR